MAHYLSSLGHEAAASPQSNAQGNDQAARLERLAQTQAVSLASSRGARAFEAACAVCHVEGPVATFGLRPSLAVNSAVRAPVPDNLIHTILQGASNRQFPERGIMPGFAQALSDEQVADIVTYVRQRFAPDRPAWQNVRDSVGRARAHL